MNVDKFAERCHTIGLWLGPPRYFVGFCENRHLFYNGPSGFIEFSNRREAEAAAPIIARRDTT